MDFDGVDIENLDIDEIMEIYDNIVEEGDIIGGLLVMIVIMIIGLGPNLVNKLIAFYY